MRPVILFLALALGLYGCGPKEVTELKPSPPAPTISADWRHRASADVKASFATPSDWKTAAEQQQEDAAATNELGSALGMGENLVAPGSMPDTAAGAPGSVPSGTISVAPTYHEPTGANTLVVRKTGVVGETSFPTRIEFAYQNIAGGTNLKDQAKKIVGDLPGGSGEQMLQLAIGPCAKVEHKVKSRDGESGTVITYVVVDKEHVWTARFQTEQDPSTITRICDEVMETFRPVLK
ncbi:MAG: hypothetical protein IT207_08495 [Fimbriimonadaceae bacterium]|nr:hypothetical protein [Fimbriimonadaceae bacterium]